MKCNLARRWTIAFGLFLLSSVAAATLLAQPPVPKGKDFNKDLPRGEFRTLQGTVREFTTAPKGETDGLILNSGDAIHWPPHLADRFSAIVAKGDRIKATGYMDSGPKRDDPKLEVSTLTNLRTNKTVENPDQPAPERAAPGNSGDVEQRLEALENKMDQVLRELRRLNGKK